MEYVSKPQIKCERKTIPTIYLDSCVMIEFARFQMGECTNEHEREIGELYDVLTLLMKRKQILCPLGNQIQEMGVTKNREKARQFLFQFTNAEMIHPDIVYRKQMQASYQSFIRNEKIVMLGTDMAFKKEDKFVSPYIVHVYSICSEEKARTLRDEKYHIVDVLNRMKENKEIRPEFEKQLAVELETEYILFQNNVLNNPRNTEEAYYRYFEEMETFYRITRLSPECADEQRMQEIVNYVHFLKGLYHDFIPYVWIRANLWTHLMQRPKKIVQGDNLDVQWAAAYLPFVDYAVTDNAFCELLRGSGLLGQYKTKVYSFKSLKGLLEELTRKLGSE